MSGKRFECDSQDVQFSIVENGELILANPSYVVNLLNSLQEENEQLKNELRKEKLLLEYSDSMYNADLIVNIRYSNGEWKADVSVIDNE